METCWDAEPNKRPLFVELAECLGDLLEDDTRSVRYLLWHTIRTML